MLVVGVLFLTFAVLFGLIILNAILKNKKTPKPIVFLHGAVALFAILVIVGYVVAGHTDPTLVAALVFFILAGLGGLTLLSFDLRKKPIPKMIALVHPLVAIAGVVLLVVHMIQQAALS